MKRFLAKAARPFNLPSNSQSQAAPSPPTPPPNSTGLHTGLQPKYVVPPVPHPCPHDHIALLVTKQGLLLRPHIPGLKHPASSHVRIPWGKTVTVEDMAGDGEAEGADWNDSVIVYGIVGALELYSGTYRLVQYIF